MKRLFLAVAALAAPFAILVGLFEVRLAKAPAPNQFAAKKCLLERQKQRVEVLVLGSSHSVHGILPSLLGEPAFNLSGVSQSLYYDHALLAKYLIKMPSLKLVVCPVSYFSLEWQLDESIESWRCYYYRYEWGLPHRDWHMTWHARNFSGYCLCGSELGRKNILFGKIKDATTDFDLYGGWTNRPFVSDNLKDSGMGPHLPESAVVALKRHHSGMKQEQLPENAQILTDILRQVKYRGIGLVLVTLPVSRYYADGMNSGAYQRMQATLRQVTATDGVEYLNYTFDRRFSDADFYDADHLNALGAHKFSLILRDEVISRRFSNRPKEAPAEKGVSP